MVVACTKRNYLNAALARAVVVITFQLYQSCTKQPKYISIQVQVSKMGVWDLPVEVFAGTCLSSLFPWGTWVCFVKGSAVVFPAQPGHGNCAALGVGWRTGHGEGTPTLVLLLLKREETNELFHPLLQCTLAPLATTVSGYFSQKVIFIPTSGKRSGRVLVKQPLNSLRALQNNLSRYKDGGYEVVILLFWWLKMLSSKRGKGRSVTCVKYLVACCVLAGVWQRKQAVTLGAELLWLTGMSSVYSSCKSAGSHLHLQDT